MWGPSPDIMQPGYEGHHSPQCRAEIKKMYGALPPPLLDKSQSVASLNTWTTSQFNFMA